jgi:hypothetical protein
MSIWKEWLLLSFNSNDHWLNQNSPRFLEGSVILDHRTWKTQRRFASLTSHFRMNHIIMCECGNLMVSVEWKMISSSRTSIRFYLVRPMLQTTFRICTHPWTADSWIQSIWYDVNIRPMFEASLKQLFAVYVEIKETNDGGCFNVVW